MTFAAGVLTLYPEMFPGPLGHSLAGRAMADGIWSLSALHLREFATDKHRTVDDTPAGGGPGMVLRVDVLARGVAALRDTLPAGVPVLALTPRAPLLTQARVRALAAGPGVGLVCGRFEGFDERLFTGPYGVEPVSIGDFVLSGGEPAALVVLDACIRLLPGVMGAAESGTHESFEQGLLEHPHYTRPASWAGQEVPEVLRSGDHAKVARWRQARSEEDTRLWRPDLWERYVGARVHPPSGAQGEKDE